MMDYLASITYRNPVPPSVDRAVEASREQPLARACGARSASGSTPAASGYCPIDAVELGPGARGRPARSTGTITNFTVVTPVQYPGQTETEPFARVFVLLDGTDVILPYQPVIELPADDVRVGERVVGGVGLARPRTSTEGGGMGGAYGSLLGWMPDGEPDVDDPDLVNRIF